MCFWWYVRAAPKREVSPILIHSTRMSLTANRAACQSGMSQNLLSHLFSSLSPTIPKVRRHERDDEVGSCRQMGQRRKSHGHVLPGADETWFKDSHSHLPLNQTGCHSNVFNEVVDYERIQGSCFELIWSPKECERTMPFWQITFFQVSVWHSETKTAPSRLTLAPCIATNNRLGCWSMRKRSGIYSTSTGPWRAEIKGEVRAIGRFWVFDGNGLLGHQLIDSRWFEKNPPTESGWKRRSKNRRSTGISRGNDRDVMSAFDFAPIYTPFDQHGFFAFDFGRVVDRWWLKEVWYAQIRSWFFAKPLYSSDLHCSKKKHEARVN